MSKKRFFILKDEEYEDVLPCIRDRTSTIKDIYGHYKYDDLTEICNELNELVKTNRNLYSEKIEYRHKIKQVLQLHYNYAKNQRQKNLDNVLVAHAYDVLRYTVWSIAQELGVELE